MSFYKVENGKLVKLEYDVQGSSINDIISHLGFKKSEIHTVFVFDSKKVDSIGFNIFTAVPVFALFNTSHPKFSDIIKEINVIDWDEEYSSLNINDILDDGIGELTFEYLSSILHLKNEGKDLYSSEQLQLYLQFENGKLLSFSSSGWENSSGKWLQEINPYMFKAILNEAQVYHTSEMDAIEEVNLQAESILNIPQSVNNEYTELHRKASGNVNFYNLRLAHYTQNTTLEEFLFVNKGRCLEVDKMTYNSGVFTFRFNPFNNDIEITLNER